MPYITRTSRLRVLHDGPDTGAELAYLIFNYVMGFWRSKGATYRTITEIRGALHAALTEFDRRYAFPYEDSKIQENGDV